MNSCRGPLHEHSVNSGSEPATWVTRAMKLRSGNQVTASFSTTPDGRTRSWSPRTHDMILRCAEVGESIIWIDPRGRQFKRTELVPLVFTRAEEWTDLLKIANGPVCIHVLRTKTDVLTLARAGHLVEQRMRRLQARKRAQTRKAAGPLFAPEEANEL